MEETSKKSGIAIPFGWKRSVCQDAVTSTSHVTYMSPSGTVLSSIAEICQYLENNATCKCGLQCPLHVPKVFSFNPQVHSLKMSKKNWVVQDKTSASHSKSCAHWKAIRRKYLAKKKKTATKLVLEPPTKLLIIRKGGQLTSVIPDKKPSASGSDESKKPKAAKTNRKLPKTISAARTHATSTLPIVSRIKSPLFESASTLKDRPGKNASKSKSEFKLQWIKADDELSHNDAESGNEMCFSPDFKKSPPISLPHSLLSSITSPTSVRYDMTRAPNSIISGPLFSPTSSTSIPAVAVGVEPVHRFGRSAFPGSNFMMKSAAGFDNNAASHQFHMHRQHVPRYPQMMMKAEHDTQNNPYPVSGSSSAALPNDAGMRYGAMQGAQRFWQQDRATGLGPGEKKQQPGMTWRGLGPNYTQGFPSSMTGTIMGQRGQLPTLHETSPMGPGTPQQFPMGSPPPCNPTSPYSYPGLGQGPGVVVASPGHVTSPYSNRSHSRSSSMGTPTPSPHQPGQWQGCRAGFPNDISRPQSRSSNVTTPRPTASPSPMQHWGSANQTMAPYHARAAGAKSINPDPCQSPMSTFSQRQSFHQPGFPRYPQNSMGSFFDPSRQAQFRGQEPGQIYPNQQQPFSPNHPSNTIQRFSQFSMVGQYRGSMVNQPNLSNNKVNPRPTTAQHMEGLMRGPVSVPLQAPPHHGHMHHRGIRMAGDYPLPTMEHSGSMTRPHMQNVGFNQGMTMQGQWRPFGPGPFSPHHRPPTQFIHASGTVFNRPMGPRHMTSPSMSHVVARMPVVSAAGPKPKKTRRRRVTKAAVTTSAPLPAPAQNFVTTEFSDFFGQTHTNNSCGEALAWNSQQEISHLSETLMSGHTHPVLPPSSEPDAIAASSTPSLVIPLELELPRASCGGKMLKKTPEVSPVISQIVPTLFSPEPEAEPMAAEEIYKTSDIDTVGEVGAGRIDPERRVTTPPLPLLSPNELEDGNRFSDFGDAEGAVFDFVDNAFAKRPKLEQEPTAAQKVERSKATSQEQLSSAHISTECLITSTIFASHQAVVSMQTGDAKCSMKAEPHVSPALKQFALATSSLPRQRRKSGPALVPTSSIPLMSCRFTEVTKASFKHPSLSRASAAAASTRLVSSSGKVFQVPDQQDRTSKAARRFSSYSVGKSSSWNAQETRKRYPSDPYPVAAATAPTVHHSPYSCTSFEYSNTQRAEKLRTTMRIGHPSEVRPGLDPRNLHPGIGSVRAPAERALLRSHSHDATPSVAACRGQQTVTFISPEGVGVSTTPHMLQTFSTATPDQPSQRQVSKKLPPSHPCITGTRTASHDSKTDGGLAYTCASSHVTAPPTQCISSPCNVKASDASSAGLGGVARHNLSSGPLLTGKATIYVGGAHAMSQNQAPSLKSYTDAATSNLITSQMDSNLSRHNSVPLMATPVLPSFTVSNKQTVIAKSTAENIGDRGKQTPGKHSGFEQTTTGPQTTHTECTVIEGVSKQVFSLLNTPVAYDPVLPSEKSSSGEAVASMKYTVFNDRLPTSDMRCEEKLTSATGCHKGGAKAPETPTIAHASCPIEIMSNNAYQMPPKVAEKDSTFSQPPQKTVKSESETSVLRTDVSENPFPDRAEKEIETSIENHHSRSREEMTTVSHCIAAETSDTAEGGCGKVWTSTTQYTFRKVDEMITNKSAADASWDIGEEKSDAIEQIKDEATLRKDDIAPSKMNDSAVCVASVDTKVVSVKGEQNHTVPDRGQPAKEETNREVELEPKTTSSHVIEAVTAVCTSSVPATKNSSDCFKIEEIISMDDGNAMAPSAMLETTPAVATTEMSSASLCEFESTLADAVICDLSTSETGTVVGSLEDGGDVLPDLPRMVEVRSSEVTCDSTEQSKIVVGNSEIATRVPHTETKLADSEVRGSTSPSPSQEEATKTQMLDVEDTELVDTQGPESVAIGMVVEASNVWPLSTEYESEDNAGNKESLVAVDMDKITKKEPEAAQSNAMVGCDHKQIVSSTQVANFTVSQKKEISASAEDTGLECKDDRTGRPLGDGVGATSCPFKHPKHSSVCAEHVDEDTMRTVAPEISESKVEGTALQPTEATPIEKVVKSAIEKVLQPKTDANMKMGDASSGKTTVGLANTECSFETLPSATHKNVKDEQPEGSMGHKIIGATLEKGKPETTDQPTAAKDVDVDLETTNDRKVEDSSAKPLPNAMTAAPSLGPVRDTSSGKLSHLGMSATGLGLSPDLSDTVIRQLSNYNTLLKNLLVSGVGPIDPAALGSDAEKLSGSQAKVLAVLSKQMQLRMMPSSSPAMLLFQDAAFSSGNPGMPGTSGQVSHGEHHMDFNEDKVNARVQDLKNLKHYPSDSDESGSYSSDNKHSKAKQLRNYAGPPPSDANPKMPGAHNSLDGDKPDINNTQIAVDVSRVPTEDAPAQPVTNQDGVGSPQVPSTSDLPDQPKDGSHCRYQRKSTPSPRPKGLPAASHQGLQVPIVSSSVKGTQLGESEDDCYTTETDTPKMPKQKSPIDEVSTSQLSNESPSCPALCNNATGVEQPSVSISDLYVMERRRGRSRTSAIKQSLKRPATPTTPEKAPKRANVAASATPNHRSGQRGSGSSEKPVKVVKGGDLIWGQMRGFPSWPGKVVKASEVRGIQQRAPLPDGKVWVKWFGDHTFAQMNPAELRTMTEGLEAHHRSRKKGRTRNRKISIHLETAIQEAVDELEQQQDQKQKKSQVLVPSSAPSGIPMSAMAEAPEPSKQRSRGRKRKAL